jgi:LPXTG-site transpeptidase (sortase) family protein
MLEIKTKRRRWPRVVASIILITLIAAGGYILLTVLSPTIPVLSGKQEGETKEKLAKPAGSFGDRLYIPQINVDVEILQGNDSSVLEKGAWHRKPENGDPIKGGNFVLSAHRFVMSYTPQGTAIKSPFYNIGNLQIGDRVFVDFKGMRYEYEIAEKYAVKPDGVEVEAPTREPQLTLYSCTLQGSSDGRDVLEARLVTDD